MVINQINITKEIDDLCVRSMILAVQSFDSRGVNPVDNQKERIICNYLADYCSLFDINAQNEFVSDAVNQCILQNDLLKKYASEHWSKLSLIENEYSYDDIFNHGIYNLLALLDNIDCSDKLDEDILLYNSCNDYEKSYLLLEMKCKRLVSISLGVSSFIINEAQKRGDFQWDKHYNTAANSVWDINYQRQLQNLKLMETKIDKSILELGDCFLTDAILIIELYRIRQQCVLQKLLIALLFILQSPEYSVDIRDYSYFIIDLLDEISFSGRIHRIYFQEKLYNVDDELSYKSSKDATTRISIILSTANDDFYIMRIDMPHKGENVFHINMEECIGDRIVSTGYPMDIKFAREQLGAFSDEVLKLLFFEMNGMVWFKSNFKHIIEHINLMTNQKKVLLNLFKKQSHISIVINNSENDIYEQLSFIEELKKYFYRFNIAESKFAYFGKDDIKYSYEIKNCRMLFELERKIEKIIIQQAESNMNSCPRFQSKKILEVYARYADLSINESDLSHINSIIDVWQYLKKYI